MARNSSSQPLTSEDYLDLHFPKAGVDVSCPAQRQTVRGKYPDVIYTCADALNVRAFDADDRLRGGSRRALAKYNASAVVADWIIQGLDLLVGTGYDPPGGLTMPLSQSGRITTILAVSRGKVYAAVPEGNTWSQSSNVSSGDPPLNSTGVVMSAPNGQKMYYVDGVNYRIYDPATHRVTDWTPTAGSLPVDADNNTARLIETWRGRTVVSGLLGDGQNWFMSKAGDPLDWDYGATPVAAGNAVAGNNAPAGRIGDTITAIVPYNDDVLIFGCDHQIWMMSGDPTAGGQLDLVNDSIGFAWGKAWCRGSDGAIYFFSNRTGIYRMVPGSAPVRISQAIDPILREIDTGDYGVRMAWDDRYQGLHVFVTLLAEKAVAQHWFYESRSEAWFPDQFGLTKFNPICCCIMDGNTTGDRVVLIGSWDGFVRFFSVDAVNDDGFPFTASVLVGPVLTKNFDDMLLKDLQAVLGQDVEQLKFEVLVGRTAEEALASTPVYTGYWSSGRSFTSNIRRAGHAVYIRLSSTKPWSMEAIRARFAGRGKVRGRGR